MKIKIKKFEVDMELKNKGVELEVRNTKDEFLGDIVITKTGIIWCQGKTSIKNGVRKSWEEIIEIWSKENTGN